MFDQLLSKKYFMFKWNFLYLSLCPLSLFLSLVPLKKVWLYLLNSVPSDIYVHWWDFPWTFSFFSLKNPSSLRALCRDGGVHEIRELGAKCLLHTSLLSKHGTDLAGQGVPETYTKCVHPCRPWVWWYRYEVLCSTWPGLRTKTRGWSLVLLEKSRGKGKYS